MYSSRLGPRAASSAGSRVGLCQPTDRLPVVDMMLVSDRTRCGRSIAIVCAIMPPIETPTTWAVSRPRWSSRPNASAAMSPSVYGGRTRRPANARSRADRVTRPTPRDERPVSRLS